jgi:hypothetical protein
LSFSFVPGHFHIVELLLQSYLNGIVFFNHLEDLRETFALERRRDSLEEVFHLFLLEFSMVRVLNKKKHFGSQFGRKFQICHCSVRQIDRSLKLICFC